jgi:hypothetical protein
VSSDAAILVQREKVVSIRVQLVNGIKKEEGPSSI